MDTFRELTPEEIKLTTIQFMGQHLMGEIKELDRNIVSKSNTLQGLTLNPEQIINSVAPPAPNSLVNTSVNSGNNIQTKVNTPASIVPSSNSTVNNDSNQLEFDFNNCDYAKQIFNRLDSIDLKLNRLFEIIEKKLI